MCEYGNDTILAVRSIARHDRSGGIQISQGIAMTRSLKLPACTAEAEYIEIDNGWPLDLNPIWKACKAGYVHALSQEWRAL